MVLSTEKDPYFKPLVDSITFWSITGSLTDYLPKARQSNFDHPLLRDGQKSIEDVFR